MTAGYDGRGARFPLTIVRGADMAFALTCVSGGSPVNLSAATIAGEVYNTSGILVDTLTAVVSGAGSNVVTLSFTDTETAAFTDTRYRWTLWVTRGADKRPWLAGQVTVTDGTNGQSGSFGSYTLTDVADGAEPLVPGRMQDVTITDVTSAPRFIEYFDGKMWGVQSGDIYTSVDAGVTWSLYCNSWPGTGPDAFIARIIPTSDGEVIAMSETQLRKSAGWVNGNSATWSATKVTPNGSSEFVGFGLDGNGTKFIVAQYATPTWADSRYAHISTDSGTTWTQVYDSVAIHGAGPAALSHLHAACYDAAGDRFYLGEGHGAIGGIYHSTDDGTTWTLAPAMRFDDGSGGYNTPTVVVATPDGLVMGSDQAANGTHGVTRLANPVNERPVQTYDARTGRLGLVMFAQRGWVDTDGVVYVTFRAEYSDVRPIIVASTTRSGRLVHEWPTLPSSAGVDRFYIAARIDDQIVAYAESAGTPYTVRGSVSMVDGDLGQILGGRVPSTGGSSVAVGPQSTVDAVTSVAVGVAASTVGADGVSVGASASTSASAATAVGKSAVAGNAGVAVGNAASATLTGVAVGYLAATTLTGATAVGSQSSAINGATAIGQAADASGYSGSVALGQASTTTAAEQVAIAARHIEMTEVTAPGAGATNSARLFARDNGSGKTQLCVRFATGAIAVLATEP
jgi:hypothetical protein